MLKDASYAKSFGSRLLLTVYKGIAPGEDRKALPALDINTKRLADGLLQLAFSQCQQVSVASIWIRFDLKKRKKVVRLVKQDYSYPYEVFLCLLMLLTIAVSLQSEQLVDLLLNTIMLSVPLSGSHSPNFLSFSHGEYFYSLFQMTINTELLRSLETTVPRLMKASSQNPTMVAPFPLIHIIKHFF